MQISRDLYNLARREMDQLAKASGGRNFLAAMFADARRFPRWLLRRSARNTVWGYLSDKQNARW